VRAATARAACDKGDDGADDLLVRRHAVGGGLVGLPIAAQAVVADAAATRLTGHLAFQVAGF
jgi:hypothetical protein